MCDFIVVRASASYSIGLDSLSSSSQTKTEKVGIRNLPARSSALMDSAAENKQTSSIVYPWDKALKEMPL